MNGLGGCRWEIRPVGPATWPVLEATDAQHWVRIGDEVVLWSSDVGAEREVGTEPRDQTAAGGPRSAGLALVTQVGRAFQDAHPRTRVILDHGRHLVVDTAGLEDLRQSGHLCWRVAPLPVDTVLVARPRRPATPPDPATVELLAEISSHACESDLERLVACGTRHAVSSGYAAAAQWAAGRLDSLGYRTTRTTVDLPGGRCENIVADHPGAAATGTPDGPDLVLVTAHLDSINVPGGAGAPAPGADDNGSGCAGLLELARVVAGHRWRHAVRFVLFGGEEEGLFGSRRYVAELAPAERARIRAVLNMDMIGTRTTSEAGVLLEGAPLSVALVDHLVDAGAAYTSLTIETSLNPFASDHVPFLDAGIPAVLTIEGNNQTNTDIHTDRDTMDRIDLSLLRDILRMNLAALTTWLDPVIPVAPVGRGHGGRQRRSGGSPRPGF